MSFVRQTITKVVNKIAAAYHFAPTRCCGHSNLVKFNRISSKLHIYGLLPSISGSSSNMSFVGQTIIKIADEMAAAYQFATIRCCGYSNLVNFNRISSKFHILFASIQPWFKFE